MLSKFSVKKPYTVLVGVILVIVLGVVSFTRMTTDLLPNLSLPYVIVMTPYPGASPETVEMAVTKPVESSMATVSNIEGISSVSSENYSMVILEFAQNSDMNSVSLEIRENLDQIKSYWDDMVGNPIIMKLNPDMLPIMVAAAGVDGMDDAQVSTYVESEIIPELESLEGVASVSATGLLEESVNVIISQEKIDKVNESIFAAIDEKMKDAEEELADGKQQLNDTRLELAQGRKELAEGELELIQGQDQISKGKDELDKQQDSVVEQLAVTKQQLLTAKTDLEATKMNLTTNMTTAQTVNATINEIDVILGAAAAYRNAYNGMNGDSVSSGDGSGGNIDGDSILGGIVSGGDILGGIVNGGDIFAEVAADDKTAEQYKASIISLKNTMMNSVVLQQMAASGDELGQIVEKLRTLDWTDSANYDTVQKLLDSLTLQASAPLLMQRVKMSDVLNTLTTGLGIEAYAVIANSTITTLNQQIALVDSGLIEVEKGELAAAIEFANASTQLTLGEYQMQLAKAQLDSAKEQLVNGEAQLDSADQQIEDGLKQLEDAKETAYEQADMNGILTVDTVKGLLTAQNFSMPAGYVTEDGIDYLVRVGDKPSDIEGLKALPLMDLHMDGVPVITLEDVADVFYTDNSDQIYTNVNGSAGVMLSIQKQTGYSTGEVCDRLLERFEKLMSENPELSIITLSDQGVYIDLVMDSIVSNILFGGALAILILILFLKDMKPTLVIACSIPISLVTAIVCMYFSGVTLNVISLSGLALGIGMLVDNSIVVIENIYRMRSEGRSMKAAAIEGSKEVAGSIIASTLTTICVFLPIVFMEGMTRQLFVDMGLTIAYSLLASLLIALTVVPAMASNMLTKTVQKKDGRFFTAMTNGYIKLLNKSLTVKPLVLLLVLVLLFVSALAAISNGTAFMSDMDSTQLTVNVQLEEGATLDQTAEVSDQVLELLMEMDDVSDVGAMVSSTSMASLTGASSGVTNATTIYVTTREDKNKSNEELAAQILEETAGLGATITVNTSSMDMSALGGSGITIQVQGKELDEIQRIAAQVAEIVRTVEGAENVSDGLEETDEELRIIIDREKAADYGLTVAQVYTQIYSRLAAATSATTLVGLNQDYNVYVINGNDAALTRDLLKELAVDGTTAEGQTIKVALSEIAVFETNQALKSINRADQNRYVSVTVSIADGYNVGLVGAEIEEVLSEYEMPDGYKLVFSGENETINEALGQVMLMLVLALIFMYLIMVAQFQSLLAPFIIMFTIPLAFTGGFLGLYISGSEVSVIAMIGFVMLSGIIVNNGIVLIDYMNQLREEGVEKTQAILIAGRTRLRPVLMTALTTILALSTMVFSNDMGSEMAKPMAIVTIGGLVYGTLLTLIVIPCVYDYFIRNKKANNRWSVTIQGYK